MPRHFGCYYPPNWLWPHKKSAELTSESDKVIHILYGVFYSTLILIYLFHFHSVICLLVLLGPQWGYLVYVPPKYQWITLCASTSNMLLLLLFNFARGLWILYSRKTGRWSMRVQDVDKCSSAGSGPESFFGALRRLSRAIFGQYLFRKCFK